MHDNGAVREVLVLATAILSLLGGGAVAQQVPIGAHYAARGSDVGSVSPTGGYDLSLPIDLPAAKGDLPAPFELRYNASSRVGEGGVGWSIPFSYIVRSDSLTHRRPKHRDVTVVPEAEPRIILVQGGTPTRMVPIGAFTYRPMIGSQGLLLTDLGAGGWELHDGSGRAFRFERLPSLPDESIWVLTLITDRTGPNHVRLSYTVDQVPVAGSEATEVSLSAIRYNFHPSGDCAKHEVKLRYEHPSDAPEILAYVVQNGHVWARTKVLTEIEVLAVDGASCLGVLRRLLGYRLTYRGSADTQMPRLVGVDRIGEAGTPEGEVALPIARYEYGAATSAEQVIGAGAITIPRVLKYKETETVAFPPEVGGLAAGTLGATFISEGGLTEFRTTSALQDFTGDALPDLVFRNSSAGNAQLWIARNETDFAGTSLGQAAPLFPPALAGVPLSEQWLSGPRYGYETQMNIESTFVQIIDFNGDGRPDVLDARDKTDWTAYLNYPGPNGQPTWVVKTIETENIRQALHARGFTDISSTAPLPLSRSKTGQDLSLRRCVRLHSDGEWQFDCPDDPDLPPDEDVFNWGDQYTLVEWKLADLNGDGFPDLVASNLARIIHEPSLHGERRL
jgi:hypothetical protein